MLINIRGDIFGTSGYSVHARGLANAFHGLGCNVRIETGLVPNWELMVSDDELSMIKKDYDSDCVTVFIGIPPFWRLSLADNPSKFIGFLVWEGDRIPAYWVEYVLDSRVDQVWVPSRHVLEAIQATFSDLGVELPDKVKIVPHGVDNNVFKPREVVPNDVFSFICNKGWVNPENDRGGVQYVLKAFNEEFDKEEAVRLVLKLNPAYIPQGVAPEMWIDGMLDQIGFDKEKSNLFVNYQRLSEEQLSELYNDSDVFVCATRGEAFNIPGLEAKACGLSVIQTGFGGQIDYMDETDCWIDYELEPVTWDITYEGVQWATPSIKHLRHLMRYAFDNKKRSDVGLEGWSWEDSAYKGLEFLKEVV